ncbi:MAG TPA: hypothetical protein VE462_12055 [Propionibacteriaceae bacterium]|jgi:hypothetical protein|nr:hypothetical protein [Propionibacteriaceae bacterium]
MSDSFRGLWTGPQLEKEYGHYRLSFSGGLLGMLADVVQPQNISSTQPEAAVNLLPRT